MRVSDLAHQDQNIHKSSLFKFWSSTQDKPEPYQAGSLLKLDLAGLFKSFLNRFIL